MTADLLKIYLRSQISSFYEYLFFAALFIYAKASFIAKSFEDHDDYIIAVVGLMIFLCVFAVLLTSHRYYQEILSVNKKWSQRECRSIAFKIGFKKSILMTLWLAALFSPIKAPYFYDLAVGYFFCFCAVSFFSSRNSIYQPLFLTDLLIQVAAVCGVTLINMHLKEPLWVCMAFLLFAVHSFISGRMMEKTTHELVHNRYKLEKAARESATANQAKTDFLSVMAHEIRTPMAGVLGMVDFLKETPLTEQQSSCVNTISQCSKTLLNTLNDVLDITKEESGSLTLRSVNFDIHEAVLTTFRSMEHIAKKKNLTLDIIIDDNVIQHTYGDPHRLQQVIFNLLNNALKFTTEGGVTLKVGMIKDIYKISVIDTGIGISAEKVSSLFRKFSQENVTISQKYGGSGLGLSITKQLVELMNGTIDVTTRKGHGSTFTFTIPHKKPIDTAASSVQPPRETEAISNRNILLVEDNQINQLISSRYLVKKGCNVVIAQDGDSAIRHVREGLYDLILMDSSMPGKSGIETTREIKAMGKQYADIPIVALTANALESHINDCLKEGMVDYLIKPFSSEQLYALLEKHLSAAPAPAPTVNDNTQTPRKELPGKLRDLAQEFGDDYMRQTVTKSLAEIVRLKSIILDNNDHSKTRIIEQTAHDIKSISGYIGLDSVRQSAERIEILIKENREWPEIEKEISTLSATFETGSQNLLGVIDL